jgi:hypothetical protein
MVYQQQKYISHCSGGWEVQDQGIWWGLTFIHSHFLTIATCGRGARNFSGTSFIRALIPFLRASPSWPIHLPKLPPPDTITLGNTSFKSFKYSTAITVLYANIFILYAFTSSAFHFSFSPCYFCSSLSCSSFAWTMC